MYFFVVLALLGWPLISIYFFRKFREDEAVMATVILGTLFLPVTSLEIPFFIYEKDTVIGLSLLIGRLSKSGKSSMVKKNISDYSMLIYCVAVPILTSFSNGLGLVDAYYSMIPIFILYWIVFQEGRKSFHYDDSIQKLCEWIVLGGVIYLPLCLYEIRMSPQLSIHVYGFFAHSFLQHFRYGGYRPIVFMNHGLMVALWMACASVTSFWLWRSKKLIKIRFIPMWIVTLALCITTVLCKSANGIVFMVVGIGLFYYEKLFKQVTLIKLMIYLIPSYIFARVFGIVSADNVGFLASFLFDEERISSLLYRLRAEDLYGRRALLRPLFGWGGWGRNRPVDSNTGRQIQIAIDSFFLINFSRFGFLGLGSIYFSLLFGPNKYINKWKKYRRVLKSDGHYYMIISLILIFFLIDSLLNSMVNPIYILCAGALITQLSLIEKRV